MRRRRPWSAGWGGVAVAARVSSRRTPIRHIFPSRRPAPGHALPPASKSGAQRHHRRRFRVSCFTGIRPTDRKCQCSRSDRLPVSAVTSDHVIVQLDSSATRCSLITTSSKHKHSCRPVSHYINPYMYDELRRKTGRPV